MFYQKAIILFLVLFMILSFAPHIAMAQLPECNDSKIVREGVEEITIDKDGFITDKKTFSFENEDSDCLFLIHNAFDIESENPIKDLNFYDSDGLDLSSYLVHIDYHSLGLLFTKELYDGKVYKIHFDSKVQNSIKCSIWDFCMISNLQISPEYDKSTLIISVENQDPWFDTKFSEVNPPSNNGLGSNIMTWELGKSDVRIVKSLNLRYSYAVSWNTIYLILVSSVVGILLAWIADRLGKLNSIKKIFRRESKKESK